MDTECVVVPPPMPPPPPAAAPKNLAEVPRKAKSGSGGAFPAMSSFSPAKAPGSGGVFPKMTSFGSATTFGTSSTSFNFCSHQVRYATAIA